MRQSLRPGWLSPTCLAECAQICYGRVVSVRLPIAFIRFISLLLVAVIGLQASEPIRGLRLEKGSAFSAATYDTALTSKRRADVVQTVAVPLPSPPAVKLKVSYTETTFTLPAARPDSIGPPALSILARQPAPRAPPLT